MEPELIADYCCVVGEGPLWHEAEQRLYWVDIPAGRIFRYDPVAGSHEQVHQDAEAIGGFTFQADGALLLFMARGAVKIWKDGALTTVIDEIPAERDSRFNDVIADPMGRVFCGTMPAGDRLGRLYRLDPDGALTEILDGIGCSNGMGFTPDRTRMYYTDSNNHVIYLFDYDQATGAITNQRDFLRTAEDAGLPDGMAVSARGTIWSARWDDGHLYHFAPDGSLIERFSFPAKKVSSVTFGGPDYTDAYVTTAGGDDKPNEGAGAGALFRIRPGMRGQPAYLSRVGLSPRSPEQGATLDD